MGSPSTVSVVGLGRLGAPMAAVFASKGFRVIGVDTHPDTVREISEGRPPVAEPGLAQLISENRPRIRGTTDLRQAILESDLTFVVVPTPSDDHGGFSLRHVATAMEGIGQALREKRDRHVVSLTSTVLPGSTEHHVLPVLERASGKRCGVDFGLCYNPEFIALGTCIRDLLNPDFILIGESDVESGNRLSEFYAILCDNSPPLARTNFMSAELAKLAVNTYVTTKITFVNMLAEICERLPGADIDVVSRAIGLDARIGPSYLKGGMAYGGPCFPRDNLALAYLARAVGTAAPLAEATDTANQQQIRRLVSLLNARLEPGSRVAVLGLSYKPGTNVVERAAGLELASALIREGYAVTAYDALARAPAQQVLGDAPHYASSAVEAVRHVDAVVLANPESEYAQLDPQEFSSKRDRVLVLDCWRVLSRELRRHPRIDYVAIGIGPESWEQDWVPPWASKEASVRG